MSQAARIVIPVSTSLVWRVLADLPGWPQWSASVVAVAEEDSAYRVEQPPQPTSTWTITDWRPERGFSWQTRGVSTLHTVTYELSATDAGMEVAMDLVWSGSMAWMARAAYGPIAIRHAEDHLKSLARRCAVP